MRSFVHSSAARGRRWLKLQSNEFEPRWVLTASFIQIGQPEVGERARTPDRQTDRQTDTQSDNKGRLELSGAREPTDKPVGDLVRAPPLSKFRAPPF